MGIKYNTKYGYYEVSYCRRHPLTKQPRSIRRIGIRTKTEAIKVHKKIKSELLLRFHNKTHPKWDVVVEEFLRDFRNSGIANNTILNYESTLKRHTYATWKNKRIHEVSARDVTELILVNMGKYSEAHRKSMLKHLRAVFKFAVAQDYLRRDPTPNLKFKNNVKIKKVLTETQIRILLERAQKRAHPWFSVWTLACYTGMRNGELYALKWEDVDLGQRLIIVRRSWTKENGYKDTKSGDDRVVEIAKSMLPVVEALHRHKSDEFVLPRLKGWQSAVQSKVLRGFLEEIGLPVIRFHDLRASWATVMLSKGVEPIKVMAMGGWKDLKTMQVYVRKSGVDIKGITNALEFLL